MKRLMIIALVLVLVPFASLAKLPVSFTEKVMDVEELDHHMTMGVNVAALLVEDAENVGTPGIPYRVAMEQAMHSTINNSGTMETLADGSRLWRLRVTSPRAEFISVHFVGFELPIGAELYAYSVEQDSQKGPFTFRNNNSMKIFRTPPVAGDSAVIELYLPASYSGTPGFVIDAVSHGYRDYDNFAQVPRRGEREVSLPPVKASMACEVDVVCSEGNGWQDDKNAVARTFDGSYLCSGAMIANERQDCTNYFLTAAHCVNKASRAAGMVFRWNYERPNCGSGSAPTNNESVGSSLRFTSSASDVTLLELNAAPDAAYNVYYGGFSNSTSTPQSATCIHHPAGDVKKISHEYDPLQSGGSGGWGNDHWRIVGWDVGTTEGGSSGSPLFNSSHQIIGQLHGGTANCSGGWDEYGKLDVSWAAGLDTYLDPDNTGVTAVNGHYPNANCTGGGPGCAAVGEPCVEDIDCCSTSCKGKTGSKTCK